MIRFSSIRLSFVLFRSLPFCVVSIITNILYPALASNSISLLYWLPWKPLGSLVQTIAWLDLTWLGSARLARLSILFYLIFISHFPSPPRYPPSSSSFPKPRTPLSLAAALYSAFVLVFHCILFPISFQRLLVNLSLHSIYSLHLPTSFTLYPTLHYSINARYSILNTQPAPSLYSYSIWNSPVPSLFSLWITSS